MDGLEVVIFRVQPFVPSDIQARAVAVLGLRQILDAIKQS